MANKATIFSLIALAYLAVFFLANTMTGFVVLEEGTTYDFEVNKFAGNDSYVLINGLYTKDISEYNLPLEEMDNKTGYNIGTITVDLSGLDLEGEVKIELIDERSIIKQAKYLVTQEEENATAPAGNATEEVNITEEENITIEENITEVPVSTPETVDNGIIEENVTEVNETVPVENITEIVEEVPVIENVTQPVEDAVQENITEIIEEPIEVIDEPIIDNVTEPVITEENITMVPIVENITAPIAISEEKEEITEQITPQVVIGKPVKWKKIVKVNNTVLKVEVEIPKEAKNVSVREIEDGIRKKIAEEKIKVKEGSLEKPISSTNLIIGESIRVTGYAVLEEEKNTTLVVEELIEEEIEVEYETPGPSVEEKELDGKKEITISSEVHYENILSYTTINDVPKERIKLYRTTGGIRENTNIITYEDHNENGLIDYIEWIIPSLSNQTYEIVIEIEKAVHLNESKDKISDITNEAKELDNLWSEPIYEEEYVRVTFEVPLTAGRDITLYARNNQSLNTFIEVYYFNSTEKITEFPIITDEKYYKVILNNLVGSHDTFDLKIVNTDPETTFLEFDHIIDPNNAPNTSSPIIGASIKEPLDSDILAYYKFEGNADDETGVNNGTEFNIGNNLTSGNTTQGRIGRAYNFDGNDDFVNITHDERLNFNNFTIEAWVNLEDATTNSQAIASKDHAAGSLRTWTLSTHNTNGAIFTVSIDGTNTVNGVGGSEDILQNNTWYHIAGTFNGTSPAVYINGELQGVGDAVGDLWTNTMHVCIGAKNLGCDAQNFNGAIDELIIWNRTLTEEEINERYNLSRGFRGVKTENNLGVADNETTDLDDENNNISIAVNWYENNKSLAVLNMPFLNDSATDFSGFGNDGVIGNTTGTDIADPVFNITGGIIGGAYEFDGLDDFINLTGDFDNDVNALAIEAWTKFNSTTNGQSVYVREGTETFLAVSGLNGGVTLRYKDIGDGQLDATGYPLDGEWHYVVAQWNGTGTEIYIDGVLKSSEQVTGTISYPGATNPAIGKKESVLNYFNGTIDEFRIYNRSLSAEQIQEHYLLGYQTLVNEETVKGNTYHAAIFVTDGLAVAEAGNTTEVLIENTPLNTSNPVIGAYAKEPLDTSIVAYYKLEGSADDETGTNNGTETNFNENFESGNTTQGRQGRAYNFDGNDDFVNISDDDGIDFDSGDFTTELWFKTNHSASKNILTHRDSASPSKGYYIDVTTGVVRCILTNSSGTDIVAQSTTNIMEGSWHHVACVYDRDDVLTLYLDGVSEDTTDISPFPSGIANTNNLHIGANRDGGSNFNGTIDEVIIWNRSLTGDEISERYNSSSGFRNIRTNQDLGVSDNETTDQDGDSTDIVVNWYENNKSLAVLNMPFLNDSATDFSGFGNDGEIGNLSGNDDADPVYNPEGGIIGGAYEFDGLDDFINLTGDFDNDVNALAIEAWTKTNSTASGQSVYIRENTKTYLSISNDTQFTFRHADIGDGQTNVGAYPLDGEWHYVVAQWDGINTSVYIDGELEATEVANGTITYPGATNPAIGKKEGGLTYFNGSIDEFRIYNRTLSAEQIEQHYLLGYQTLVNEETVKGNTYHAAIFVTDGLAVAEAGNTTEILIDNNPPTVPRLHDVLNESNFTGIPSLNWSNSTDEADGDFILYYIDVSRDDAFATIDYYFPDKMETANTTGIISSNLINNTEDYLLFMPFEENITHAARDYSSLNNSGYFNNTNSTPFYNATGGVYGSGAYEFDGVNTHIIVQNETFLNFTRNFTIESWIKTSASNGAIFGGFNEQTTGSTRNFIQIEGGTGAIQFDQFPPGGGSLTGNKTITDGNWHQIVVVQSEDERFIYVDGTLDVSDSEAENYTDLQVTRWLIGARTFGTNHETLQVPFAGTIDEVKVYNRSLSADEVLRAFEQGNPNIQDDTYYWRVLAFDNETDQNSSYSETRIFSLDTVAPNITFINQTDEDDKIINETQRIVNGSNLTIRVNATELGLGTEVSAVWIEVWTTVKDSVVRFFGFLTRVLGDIFEISFVINETFTGATEFNYTIYANDTVNNTVEFNSTFYVEYVPVSQKPWIGAFVREPLNDSIVVYYKFEGNIDDALGLNNATSANLDTTGLGNISQGKIGRGLELDDRAHINITNFNQLNPTNPDTLENRSITAMIWAQSDGVDAGGDWLFRKAGNGGYTFLLDDTSGLRCEVTDQSGNTVSTFRTFTVDNEWHQYAMVIDLGNDVCQIYSDGIQVGADIDISSVTDQINSTQDLAIAGSGSSANAANWNGTIDEVIIFNKTLTANEISEIYNQGAGINNITTDNDLGVADNATTEDNDEDTTIAVNWYENNKSLAVLNMPFLNDSATDFSGFGNDANFINGTFNLTGGILGGAFEFDGVDDFINISNSDVLNTSREITVEVWFKTLSAGVETIISKSHSGGGNFGWILSVTNSELIQFEYSTNGTGITVLDATTSSMLNNWTHMAATYNSSLARIFINGEEVANSTKLEGELHLSDNVNICIGARSIGCSSNPFNGSIDEVRIYNRTLTEDQIREHYNLGYQILVSNETVKGNTYHASIFVTDGLAVAGAGNTTEVLAENSKPEMNNLEIASLTLQNLTSEDLNASLFFTDKDGDQGNVTFNITKDGEFQYSLTLLDVNVGETPSVIIVNENTTKHENWSFIATIFDGLEENEGNSSNNVTILNAAPNTSAPVIGAYEEAPLDSDILAYFKFEGNADDETGVNNGTEFNFNNSIVSGNTTQGRQGRAYNFDGNDDFVNITHDERLNFNNFTIEAWVNLEDATTNSQVIASKDHAAGGLRTWSFSTHVTAGVILTLSTDGNTNTNANGGTQNLQNDTWYHMAGSYDGASIRVYIDGEEVGSSAKTGDLWTTTQHICIGATNQGCDAQNFNGAIDELIIWNRTLTEEEINERYNLSSGIRNIRSPMDIGVADNLTKDLDEDNISIAVNWYENNKSLAVLNMPFLNDSATDFSGFGNDGILGNTTAVEGDEPTFNTTGGIIGGAYEFDGVDDFINISDDDTLDFGTNDFTIEAWIKGNPSDVDFPAAVSLGQTTSPRAAIGFLNNSGTLRTYAVDSDSVATLHPDSGPNVLDGEWHHIVYVVDYDVGDSSYVDGVFNDSQTASFTGNFDFTRDPLIGVDSLSQNDFRHFNGTIDEVRIYNRSLSAEQIQEHYLLGYQILVSNETEKGNTYHASITVSDGIVVLDEQNTTVVTIKNISTPLLALPPNESNFSIAPAINWTNSTDNEGQHLSYYVEVDDSNDFSSPVYTNSTIRETAGNTTDANVTLDGDGKYYWRVLATVGEENSSFSEARAFNFDTTAPNITFINQTDDDDRIINESDVISKVANITIRVNASELGVGIDKVSSVWIRIWDTVKNGVELFFGFLTNIIGDLFEITVLVNDTYQTTQINYTIYVNDTLNNTKEFDNSFYINQEAPFAPLLLDPNNNSIKAFNNLTFVWTNSSDPDNDSITFEIEIANDSAFGNSKDFAFGLADLTYVNLSLPDGILYWRVRSNDTGLAGNWSETRVVDNVKAQITINALANGTTASPGDIITITVNEDNRTDWITGVNITITGDGQNDTVKANNNTAEVNNTYTTTYTVPTVSPRQVEIVARAFNETEENVNTSIALIISNSSGSITDSPIIRTVQPLITYLAPGDTANISVISELDTLIDEVNLTIQYPNNTQRLLTVDTIGKDDLSYSYNYSINLTDAGEHILIASVTDINSQDDGVTAYKNHSVFVDNKQSINLIGVSHNSITLRDQSSRFIISNGTNITGDIVPGRYIVEFDIGKITIELGNASVNDSLSNVVNQTDLDESIKPDNTRAVDRFETISNVTFETGNMTYDYNTSIGIVTIESNLEMYKCNDINNCGWILLDTTVDEENNTVRVVLHNFSHFILAENTATDTTTAPTASGGGGGGGRVDPRLDLITPGPITLALKDRVVIPLIIHNKGKSALRRITLTAEPSTTDITATLEKTFWDVMVPQYKETIELTLESHSVPGKYVVTLQANVSNPDFVEVIKLFIDLIDETAVNKTEVIEKIELVTDFFKENPECLELNEAVVEAKNALENEEFAKAVSLLDGVLKACKDLVTAEPESLQIPESDRGKTNKLILIMIMNVLALFTSLLMLQRFFKMRRRGANGNRRIPKKHSRRKR